MKSNKFKKYLTINSIWFICIFGIFFSFYDVLSEIIDDVQKYNEVLFTQAFKDLLNSVFLLLQQIRKIIVISCLLLNIRLFLFFFRLFLFFFRLLLKLLVTIILRLLYLILGIIRLFILRLRFNQLVISFKHFNLQSSANVAIFMFVIDLSFSV